MRKQEWRWALLTTTAYWLCGALFLQLAVAPGYGVGIWPPAGMALALLLMVGPRLWPAVALGAFLVHIDSLRWSGSPGQFASSAAVPAAVALGAALQALVGAQLIKRFVGYPLRLDDFYSVIRFVALGCGLSSTINASIATLALALSGDLPWDTAAFNWFTWWVGDALGVLIFSVICLVLWGRPRELWYSRRHTLLPLMLLLVAGMVATYLLVSRGEEGRQQAEFNQRSSQLRKQAQNEINRYIDSLHGLRAFFAASSSVEARDFERFAQGMLVRHPAFEALSWNALVWPQGTARGAGIAAADVALTHVALQKASRGAMEYEPRVDPSHWDAMARAWQSGKVALSQSVAASAGAQAVEPPRFAVYLPLYRGARQSPRGELVGFVAGVFQLPTLLNTIYSDEELSGLSMRILQGEPTAPALFNTEAEGLRREPGTFANRAALYNSYTLDVADRQWTMAVEANQQFFVTSLVSWLLLVGGLLFSGLLGMFLLVITGQKYRSDEIGEELRATLGKFHQAQSQLVEAEKMAALGGMVAGFAHELNTPLGVVVTGESTLQADLEKLERALKEEGAAAETRNLVGRLKEVSRVVLANAERAARMISSFKTMSVDQSSGEAREICLESYIDEVLRNYAPIYRNSGHQVILDCQAPLRICTIPGGLSQVVINILNNSLQHGFLPGVAGHFRVTISPCSEGAQLVLADDGVGIAPDVLKQIFDPFFTTRRGAGGTGLGLHLVYNIVRQQLRGTISVTSREGKGTSFDIRLPLRID